MKISCGKCGFVHDVDKSLGIRKGAAFRCAKCRNVFRVTGDATGSAPTNARSGAVEKPPGNGDETPQEAPAAERVVTPRAIQPVRVSGKGPAPSRDTGGFETETTMFIKEVEETDEEESEEKVPSSFESTDDFQDTQSFISTPEQDAARYFSEKNEWRPIYTPFRRKLVYFAVSIISLIAVLVVPVELYRPMQRLYRMIDNAQNLLGGTQAAFDAADQARMNRFALDSLPHTLRDYDDMVHYYCMAFNMILTEGDIVPEADIIKRLEEVEEPFRYDLLVRARNYWLSRFARDPGVLQVFRRYKFNLMQARLNANAAGFDITDIYIMIDSGEKKGFFKDHICFLMDSRPWSDDPWWDDPSFPGEPYEYEPSFTYWRQLSLEGKSGFDHNPIGRPEDWFLPRFSVDEWGTWFSVWLTIKTTGVFNIFTIDMEASGVKRLLLTIGGIVVGAGLVLVVMVTLLTRWLSNRVTRPITELTRGAREVAQGNYDYVVPLLQEDEFGELTHRFNEMTRGQAERVNLMETLKKILSEELALQAAKDGMVLGGVQKDCTVMFTDFAGFSTITQHMKAVEAVELINTYFEELVTIIKKYGGFPDKYIGDAIVAMFGAPVHFDDHAERAVACAVEMQWKLREINDRLRRQNKTCFEMRIGLNSGEVLAGAIGCDMKLEYTSIGETVNLANRMESIAEIGHIKIAEGTYQEIRTIFFKGVNISRTPEKLSVKGYPEPVDCYNIYIDNIRIQKNSKPTDPLIDYYTYENIDHDLKYEPWEEESVNFTKHSRFTKDWDAHFQNT